MDFLNNNISAKVIKEVINLSKNPESYKVQLKNVDKISLQAYLYYLMSYTIRRDEITPATIILPFDELADLIITTKENVSINYLLFEIFQITTILLENTVVFTNYIANIKELNSSNLKMAAFLTESHHIDITPINDLLIKKLFASDDIDRNLIIDCLKINFGKINKRALLENIVKSRDNIFVLNDLIGELMEDHTLLNTCEFWIYLGQCLAQDDNKYAVTILKSIIKHFHSNEIDFSFENYFKWSGPQSASFYLDWNNFILISDSLLEKQNHLIMPTLNLIKSLKYIDPFWLYVLFEKILKHNNNTVTNFGIAFILENYDVDTIQNTSPTLLNNLLDALNTNYLYSYDYNSQLVAFFRKSSSAIFSNITNLNLNAITLYNFLNIFHSELIDNTFNDRDLLVALIKIVANCQNLTIRSACQIMLIKILNQTWSQYNLPTILNLIEITVQIIDNRSNILLYFDRNVTALHDYEKIIVCDTLSIGTKLKIISYLLHVNVIRIDNLTAIVQSNEIDDDLRLNLILYLKTKNIELNIDLDRFYKNPKYLEILFKIRFDLAAIQTVDLTTVKLISDHINYAEHPDLYQQHLKFFNGLNFKTCDIKMFSCLQNNLVRHSTDNIEQIIFNTLELLEIADKSNLIYIFDTIEVIARSIDHLTDDILFKFVLCIDRGYREIVALRKNEYYWILIKKFMNLLLIDDYAIEVRIWRENVVEKYVDIFIDEARQNNGLGYILFKRLLVLKCSLLIGWTKFIEYLINGLIFGETLMKREQVLEGKIMKLILSETHNLDIKSHFTYETNSKIRALCIAFVFKVHKLNYNLFLADITSRLVEQSLKLGKSKPRYYAYSQHHRVKLRIVQTLATLFVLNKSNFIHSDFVLTTLDLENNQTNITILLEILAAELLTCDELLNFINSLNKMSPSKITSFLIITYLKCIKESNLALCESTIDLFLHWTMAQHFQTRLYAQITILMLIEHFNLSTHEKYTIIYRNITECLKYGNYDVNSKKVLNDFRFNPDVNLNFANLLSLETIFYNVTRITEMPEEEIIPIQLFQNAGRLLDYDFDDPTNYNYDNSLNDIDVLTNNNRLTNVIVENELEIEQMVDGNFQKKIVIPLKQTIARTIEQFDYETIADNSDGLIVVASLVTRQPNLGGLARTCEIFGVRKYVIDSLRHTESREFQALSVTAEKWLNMEEVKAHHLRPYLQMMKRKGYIVIGAEQTSNSISIEKINFPKKSIVLLGNENEGVPANLISMFDITAEIPQFGVVRSLNVHVTGAIFMWEYAKQHKICK